MSSIWFFSAISFAFGEGTINVARRFCRYTAVTSWEGAKGQCPIWCLYGYGIFLCAWTPVVFLTFQEYSNWSQSGKSFCFFSAEYDRSEHSRSSIRSILRQQLEKNDGFLIVELQRESNFISKPITFENPFERF